MKGISSAPSLPPQTRLLLGIGLSLFLINLVWPIPLELVPGTNVFGRPWTLFTSGFFIPDTITLLLSIPGLLFYSSSFDASLPMRGHIDLWLCSIIPSNLVFLLVYGAKEALMGPSGDNRAAGPMALFGGMSVALMQSIPDASYRLLPSIRVPATMLPSIQILSAIFASLAAQSFVPLLLSGSGLLSVYLYLRLVKPRDGIRGDRSISMSFAIMFPPFLRPLASLIGNKCFQHAMVFDRWGLLEDWKIDEESRLFNNRVSAQEMERRRQLALHLLNQKMAQKQAAVADGQMLKVPKGDSKSQPASSLASQDGILASQPMAIDNPLGASRPIMSSQA